MMDWLLLLGVESRERYPEQSKLDPRQGHEMLTEPDREVCHGIPLRAFASEEPAEAYPH